jgi:GxxExxY protein
MPISTTSSIKHCDQEAFHAVDKVATGLAYDIHNEYGRFLDESLYQKELAARLLEKGFSVEKELRITVTLEDFTKDYYADFLINQGVIIETKTVEALTNTHKAQTLNYLFLCGLNHGTLLNFRTERVQHQFVSTSVSNEKRYNIQWYLNDWEPSTERCRLLYSILERSLKDWGTRLEPTLYRDVITYFLGGELDVVRNIEVNSSYGTLGAQSVYLVAPDVGFSVTAAIHRPEVAKIHHQRFLSHTSLNAMHWINLAGSSVSICTIHR